MLVETVIPDALAAVGAPIVMPPRITVMMPTGIKLLPTVRTTEVEVVAPLLAIEPGLAMSELGVTPDAK